jgi:hypothetical protein
MNKWGVRLIGVFFLIAAAYNVISAVENYSLLTAGTPTPDFWGFDLLYAAVFLYPGIQLLRFRPSGHGCALNVLWMLVLLTGLVIIAAGKIVYDYYTGEIYFGAPTWLAENLRPIVVMLVPVGILFLFLIPINFLLGADVERLFGKPVAPKENIPDSKNLPS